MPDSSYLSSLGTDGSGFYDQPGASWYSNPNDPNYYANLQALGTDLGAGNNPFDWTQLGYDGPGQYLNSSYTGGDSGAGADPNGPGPLLSTSDEFKQFADKNKYGLINGQNDQGFQLQQLTQNGRAVRGASRSDALANNDMYGVVQAVVNTGLLAGAGGAIAGSYGSGGGVATDATGATVSQGAAGSGYGASGYTSPYSLGSVGTSAGKGALYSGGNTLMSGGNLQDAFKSAGYGAVGGAIGGAVSGYNPGSYITDNPTYQSYINKGVTSGINTGIRGGNIGQALAGSALSSGVDYAGNQIGGGLKDYFSNMQKLPQPTEGSSMPDYGQSYGGDSPVASYFNDMRQQSSAPVGYTNSDEVNQSLGTNMDSSAFNPDFSNNYSQPQQQAGNPLKSYMQQALGFGGRGENSPQSMNYGNVATSLMGLYDAYQKRKQAGSLAGGLSSMFGPNSPYAQQLGQTLARKDAAAGRRSQYGPREVELQAKLAEMNSRNAPAIAQLNAQRQNAQNMGLFNLMNLSNQSGLTGAVSHYATPWINSLFNQTPANSGPQLDD